MKRKNVLKFISLLGVGSFVSLAVASCGQTATPNPEPPKPVEPSNPTNPNDGAAKQLADAKKALTDLIATQNEKVALYLDYAKIKDDLGVAYDAAKTASNNNNAAFADITSATTTLQKAIEKAASDKTDFDSKNGALVTAYNNLKTALQSKTTNLDSLKETQYSAIQANLSSLYDSATKIVDATLIPASGDSPTQNKVEELNTNITTAVTSLENQKKNADNFYTSFEKQVLSKDKLSVGTGAHANNEQPANYSYVGYSGNISFNNTSNNQSGWYFAQRKVWKNKSANDNITIPVTTEANADPLTDVSWIYSLAGEGTKYALEFTYYGPTTAYLYFLYKLVKNEDATKFGLQYKLNDADAKMIQFTQAPAINETTETNEVTAQPSGDQAAGEGAAQNSSSMTLFADQGAAAVTEINPTPTVGNINVATVTLSKLKLGVNKIEFSVPTGKVTPMIGNMYLTSSADNQNKVYDDIFGNSVTKKDASTSVTVDLLKGYGLAADRSIHFRQFMGLTRTGAKASSQQNDTTYLVGYIGGNFPRRVEVTGATNNTPANNNDARTITVYVNAPASGDYYISGSYLTARDRGLKFSTGTDTNNVVTITRLKQNNWTTLGTFDTANTATENNDTTLVGNQRTLMLQAGLNKIIIAGGTEDQTNAPYIGNLTFTLKSTQTETDTNSSKDA
ncbi:FIVAR domain-containing protein [[Mycoplasma] imitans]|uniref:FIVAR domain-containing protein n=1 Tax=[Mycoplasma] imitans TaxID=29560 RepID=UPI0004824EC7|nr:FIVAR domain-containing protein [[Mycoplasma] imitans]